MADFNHWNRTLERRTLEALRADVDTLRAAAWGKYPEEVGQRRMASRIMTLIDLKLSKLGDDEARERAERFEIECNRDIDDELKA